MGVELIKDQKGKNHMVFSKDLTKEDLLMGDKIDNYEILQVLGEGSFGYVAKAKSRLNHKIYAIKQLNFPDEQKKKEIDLIENEVSILKNLEHPLIVKYYKSFKEGNCLYIVMEFMDNGDLGELIKGHKTLNKPIGVIACGIVVILWLICTFLCEEPEESIFVGSLFFALLIIYAVMFFLWMHKLYTNSEIRRYNILYHSDQVERDIEFNEDEIKIHNLSTGWVITLHYNQFVKVEETVNYFILCTSSRKLRLFIILDKSWFNKWNSETFKKFIVSKIKSSKGLEEKTERTK